MIALWYTNRDNFAPLKESIAQVRHIKPDATVVVADDRWNPMTTTQIRELGADNYTVTEFDRRGNLNGWECVNGMAQLSLDLMDLYNRGAVFKIDPDTLLRSVPFWPYTPEADISMVMELIGVMGHFNHVMGMCYRLSYDGAERALRVSKKLALTTEYPVPEDQSLSSIVSERFAVEWDTGLAGGWDYLVPEPAAYSKCAIVTFGNIRPRRPGVKRPMKPRWPKKNPVEIARAMHIFRQDFPEILT